MSNPYEALGAWTRLGEAVSRRLTLERSWLDLARCHRAGLKYEGGTRR